MNRILLYFLIFLASSLFAIDPIMIKGDIGEYPVGLFIELLEDKDGKLTVDDIQKPEFESLWFKSEKEVPNFGFTKSVYWARLQFETESKGDYLLEIGYPLLDKIDFYVKGNSELKHTRTGDLFPFESREILYKNFVFYLPLDSSIRMIYYFRFESESSMQFPVTIWSPIAFAEKKNLELYVLGTYFGIMFAMLFYNLFIWVSIRDRSYLYYIGFIFFTTYYLLNYNGIIYQFFWFGSPSLYNQISPCAIFIIFLFSTTFTLSFLHIKENLSVFYTIYKVIFLVLFLSAVASLFMSYRFGIIAGALLAVISAVWMFTVGIIMVNRDYRPAKYYLLAWITLLFGTIILPLRASGFLPKNTITEYSIFIGSALEVILLSLGLADRINELKRQNELAQIRTLETEKKLSKLKDEFLSNLSHEIRTPLSIIYAYSEMLESIKEEPTSIVEYSKEIYASAEKLNDYIEDLILITDIETKIDLRKETVTIKDLIQNSIKGLQVLQNERKIQINESISPDLSLECDGKLLEKALSAILKNAIAYNREHGTVQISSELDSGGINIIIRDSGIGMTAQSMEKVFDKFYRVDSSLTYEVSGVGVGLYIAKKIIELHKGKLSVMSEVGKGSEFIISIEK